MFLDTAIITAVAANHINPGILLDVMHALEQKALESFQREPTREFSTGELVRQIFAEYGEVRQALLTQAPLEQIAEARKRKNELHRRILYHLNKLVEEGVLQAREQGNEKIFWLGTREHIVKGKDHQIVLARPVMPEWPDGISFWAEKNWISTFNSMFINSRTSPELLRVLVRKYIPFINDCIGLHSFEQLLEQYDFGQITRLLDQLILESEDHGLVINLIISLPDTRNVTSMTRFLDYYAMKSPCNLGLLFQVKSLQKHRSVLDHLQNLFYRKKLRISFQNLNLCNGLCMQGRAGMYHSSCVPVQAGVCGQITVFGKPDIAMGTLLNAVRIQLAHGMHMFQALSGDFLFGNAVHYIRSDEEDSGGAYAFSKEQELLYNMCGIPLRFRIKVEKEARVFRGRPDMLKHARQLLKDERFFSYDFSMKDKEVKLSSFV